MREQRSYPRTVDAVHPAAAGRPGCRALAPAGRRGVGVVGIALYNWWIPVAFDRHLMSSPDELFSDLEATGRPDAALLQHLDLAAGIVLLAALLLRGAVGRSGRRAEWPWLVAFAVAGAVGGQFSYACPEGLSASCRAAEWRLALPHHHYVHVFAGIAEFVFGTVAVYLAWQRTRPSGVGGHHGHPVDRTHHGRRLPAPRPSPTSRTGSGRSSSRSSSPASRRCC